MRKALFFALLYCLSVLLCKQTCAQDTASGVDRLINFPSSFFSCIDRKTASLDEQMTKQTEKCLKRLAKREQRMKQKLYKIDSTEAKKLFANSEQQYAQMLSKINSTSSTATGKVASGEYLPYVDSIKTSLSFLSQNSSLMSNSTAVQENVQHSLQQVNELQAKLQQTEAVKTFIQQRKQQISQALSSYSNLPKRLTNVLNGYKQEAYYYSAQLKEYKETLNDPDKMVTRGLSVLNKLPAYTQFMQQYSEMASLFGLPGNYGTTESVAGLQTKSQVLQQIQSQLASTGSGGQQYLQQSMQLAQSQLSQLKDKLLNFPSTGGSGGEADMPDFKPNDQKTKTFWKRIEYGYNLQTAKSNFFPTTTDIGLSAGYKLNNKSTIGIGASYKLGWGSDIKHISLTQQGMGLRSYLDVKLKGSFYASGGYELNYQPLSPEVISSVTVIGKYNDPGAWSRSGLIGVSKIVSLKSKFFKKTKLQLLWDFLSYSQTPRTQEFKFRVGYSF